MSTLTNAPSSRAVRRIGRSRSAHAGVVASASIGSNWVVRLDSLSERLTRGIGPWSSRSIRGISGAACQRAGQAADQVEAGLLVDVGLGLADDGLAQQVGREGQRLAGAGRARSARASSGVAPGDELARHDAGGRPRRPRPAARSRSVPAGRQRDRQPEPPGDAVAGLGQVLRQVPADRARPIGSAGRASMNRKSWTRTSGSPRVQSMSRSSHQARCQGFGPRPIRSNSSRPISRVRRSRTRDRSRRGSCSRPGPSRLELHTVAMDTRPPDQAGSPRSVLRS